MSGQKSNSEPQVKMQIVEVHPINAAAQSVADSFPASHALKPDKTIKVPKFGISLNAKPITEEELKAILENGAKLK